MDPPCPVLAIVRKGQWQGLASLIQFLPYGITEYPPFCKLIKSRPAECSRKDQETPNGVYESTATGTREPIPYEQVFVQTEKVRSCHKSYAHRDTALKYPKLMAYYMAYYKNSVVQQPMRARAYCAHPSMWDDHWVLRCMSRCPEQVVSLKRDHQCLSPKSSLVLIYRPTAVGMKGI
ncbi:uncharacterized protein TNCV_3955231 [Trichonephila clavipes]|nr:uncharacterized protein TNCV_3955231 [Trichonephila clavipes]